MTTTLTISAPLAMAAVPSLLAIGGVVVGIALNGWLSTGIEVARLNADNDQRTARWLWRNGYRKTPHAGPEVTAERVLRADHEGEVLHVEHATGPLPVLAEDCCDGHDSNECNGYGELSEACCEQCPDWDNTPQPNPLRALSDESHADEQADHTDTDRPRWWATVAAYVVLAPVAFARRQLPVLAAWWRRRRDERHLIGSGDQAVDPALPLREVLAASGYELEAPEPEPVRIVRVNRYRDPGMTGQFPYVKVAGAPRHAAPEPEMPAVNAAIPAQRTGDADV